MRRLLLVLFFMVSAFVCFAFDLSITAADVRLVPTEEGALNLFVRKKSDIASVLLCETTKDPEGRSHNYALRDVDWNPVNGDELRILDGKIMISDEALFSIIDSTPDTDPFFENSFHLYLPPEMVYGYPWTRNGSQKVQKGLFINIRSFIKPFGDYTGEFKDNAFVLDIQLPPKPVVRAKIEVPPKIEVPIRAELLADFSPETVESFTKIAEITEGEVLFSKNPDDLITKLQVMIEEEHPEDQILDLVFCVDATISMKDDIDMLRTEMIPGIIAGLKKYKSFRLGLVAYKDYDDDSDFNYKGLPVKIFPFTEDVAEFNKNLYRFKVFGGRDIPEAVYEALYAGLAFYPWNPAAQRRIILIGDAEPHPTPRGSGKYSKKLVEDLSKEKDVQMDVIILFDEGRH